MMDNSNIEDKMKIIINNCCDFTNEQITELIDKLNEELNKRNEIPIGLGVHVTETIMANDKR